MKKNFRLARCDGFLFLILCLVFNTDLLHAQKVQTNSVLNSSASNFEITGIVKNNSGTPFDSVEIQAINHSTDSVITSTMTNSSGQYTLTVSHGTYDVKAIPPVNSGFTPTVLLGQVITAPAIIDFVLVPAGSCTISGQITDRDGNPVGNQPVQLSSFTSVNDTTDAMGNYSFTVSPGTYSLTISSFYASTNLHIPKQFYLWANDIPLTVNTIVNIQLPNISLAVTVQDPSNAPVPGTAVNMELAMGSTTFSTGSLLFHGNIGGSGVTDTAGHALIWLFPTTTDVRILPPDSSGLGSMLLSSVPIHADTAITVHLVPTITLSGKITDRDGSPVGNQPIQVSSFTSVNDTTDALGNFSLTVSPGTYSFTISSFYACTNPHIPKQFYLWADSITLSADSIIDIQLKNISLSVTVLDTADKPVPGATVSTELAMGSTTFSFGALLFHGNIGGSDVTDTSGYALLWMFPTTTDVRILPPDSSGFGSLLLGSVPILTDTTITVHLVPTITLSGKITDRDGSPVGNQPVQLSSFTSLNDTTDAMGNYSFTASPGTYSFTVFSSYAGTNPHIPNQFYIWANDISLPADSMINVQLPNISLSVTVLDLSNEPVPGTTVSVELAMGSTTFNAGPLLFHGNIGGSGVTDTAGNTILWMFPATADVKITPPEASGFAPIKIDSVAMLSDKSMVVHIEKSTGVRTGNELPTQYVLLQNYPNPFNPSTTIRYEIPAQTNVSLKIYNMLGQEVATLVNGTKQAGRYEARWNAVGVASGIYFYHITAGEFSATKKLLLLK